MKDQSAAQSSGGETPLCVFSGGFLTQSGLRPILKAAGWNVKFGQLPLSSRNAVGVWGRKPVSARGRFIAKALDRRLVTIEDGFLRSVYPGDTKVPPLSLMIDEIGVYYDASAPSQLEVTLQTDATSPEQIDRARSGIDLLRDLKLSKYTPPHAELPPESGYVLVVDQTAGDASIPGALADASSFHRMLDAARVENPDNRIVIKSHPDVIAGRKRGHFANAIANRNDILVGRQINPWDLIEGASAVYTVSSQMGYEALLARKPVRCFGAAFYAGWGLTEDENPVRRRTATHTRESLFAACHLATPIYFDPWHQRLCTFEDAVQILSVLLDHERQNDDAKGEVFGGVRLWKRRNLVRFRPRTETPAKYTDDAKAAREVSRADSRRVWLWASHASSADTPDTGYIEDGFLRSVGLGAELTQAASLVFDRTGIYYDPTRPSDLETLIAQAASGQADTARAKALTDAIIKARLSKYNVGKEPKVHDPVSKPVILVPGQVEDDASIRLGAGEIRTNLDLLNRTRADNPDAYIIYKPHPDVEAGLRDGIVPPSNLDTLADEVARNASPIHLIERADAVWTMTSLMGFEALLRGKKVSCLGMPFYAGWGLTNDLGPDCPRRTARPSVQQLAWATLIAYPRYVDPVSGLPCTPELIVERLASRQAFGKATILSRFQSALASKSWLWR